MSRRGSDPYDRPLAAGCPRRAPGAGHDPWVAGLTRSIASFAVDRLFTVPDAGALADEAVHHCALNPESLVTVRGVKVEPSVATDPPGHATSSSAPVTCVSERGDSRAGALIFNRTVALRDSWGQGQGQ